MFPIPRTWRTVIWLAIWLAAFTVTHLPPSHQSAPHIINDKILHFSGFAMLGIVTIWRIAEDRRTIALQIAVLWFLVLVAYGFLDERTQPWVGRSFEWLDWAADSVGAAVGILIGLACHSWVVRARKAN